MSSAAVKALQATLGGLPTTGNYLSLTRARVKAYQKAVGLPQTGVADARPAGAAHPRLADGASRLVRRAGPRRHRFTVTTADLRSTRPARLTRT